MSDNLNLGGASLALGVIFRDAIVLLLGWALGILSSPITDAIRRRSAKQRLTRAVRTELISLQDMLASVVVQISRRHRVLTHSLLEALMTTLRSSGPEAGSDKTLRTIGSLLEFDERALAATEPASPRDTIFLKVSGAPFLESHLHRLDLYSPETQRLLVEIRTGLKLFDQHAGEAMNYHLMTFASGVEGQRMDALAKNVETCYQRAAERASDLVSRIAVLMQSPEMRAT